MKWNSNSKQKRRKLKEKHFDCNKTKDCAGLSAQNEENVLLDVVAVVVVVVGLGVVWSEDEEVAESGSEVDTAEHVVIVVDDCGDDKEKFPKQ